MSLPAVVVIDEEVGEKAFTFSGMSEMWLGTSEASGRLKSLLGQIPEPTRVLKYLESICDIRKDTPRYPPSRLHNQNFKVRKESVQQSLYYLPDNNDSWHRLQLLCLHDSMVCQLPQSGCKFVVQPSTQRFLVKRYQTLVTR